MPIPPPAQRLTQGQGVSPKPANALLIGPAVKLINIDGATIRDPVQLTRVIQELASNQRQIGNSASANPFASSVTIAGITLVSGNNQINHMLGRVPIGWISSNVQANYFLAYALAPQPSGIDPNNQIVINSNYAGTIVDLIFW